MNSIYSILLHSPFSPHRKFAHRSTILCILLAGMLFIPITGSLQAQPEIEWSRTLGGTNGELVADIAITADAGTIVVGISNNSNDGDVGEALGALDAWVVKLDREGRTQWTKVYGGSKDDVPNSIIQSSDGGYLIVGSTQSNDGDIPIHADTTYYDIWLLKLSATGSIEWSKTFGGSFLEIARSVTETTDGNFIVTGVTNSNDGDVTGLHWQPSGIDEFPSDDLWVVKLSRSGDLLWQKTLGGSGGDEGKSAAATPDGGCIIAGNTSSGDGDVATGHGSMDAWCVKLSAEGNIEWEKTYGGSGMLRGGTGIESAQSIIVAKDGGYVFTGRTESHDGDLAGLIEENPFPRIQYYAWTVKLDPSGNIVWQNVVGEEKDSISYSNEMNAVIEVPGSGYAAAGASLINAHDAKGNIVEQDVDAIVLRIDDAGNLLWQKYLGGSSTESAFALQGTEDGGYLLGAASSSNDGDVQGGHGYFDYWIVRLKPEGTTSVSRRNDDADMRALNVHPNPATEQAVVELSIDHPATVQLTVVDERGIIISGPIDRHVTAGQQSITVDISSLPSGLYYVQLNDGSNSHVQPVVVVR